MNKCELCEEEPFRSILRDLEESGRQQYQRAVEAKEAQELWLTTYTPPPRTLFDAFANGFIIGFAVIALFILWWKA